MYKRVSIAKNNYMYRTCSYYPQLLMLVFILPHYHTFSVMFIFLTLVVLNKFAVTLIMQHWLSPFLLYGVTRKLYQSR